MRRLLLLVLSLFLLFSISGCSSADYKNAINLFNYGNYVDAAEIFDTLGDYKDSAEFLTICNHNIALSEYENGNYSTALAIFESIEDYKDSAKMTKMCEYELGMEAFENGDFDAAAPFFYRLGNFENSEEMYKACKYKKLIAYIVEKGDYSSSQGLYFIEDLDAANAYHFLTTDGETITYKYYALWETADSYFHFYYDCIYTLDNEPYYSLDTVSYDEINGVIVDGSAVQIEGYLDIHTSKILSVESQDLINIDFSYAKEMVVDTQERGLDFTKDIIKKSGVGLTFEELFG